MFSLPTLNQFLPIRRQRRDDAIKVRFGIRVERDPVVVVSVDDEGFGYRDTDEVEAFQKVATSNA